MRATHVSTALTLTAGHWRLSIEDRTARQTSTLSTTDETAGDFNLAEWLQENPTEVSGKATPYPDLSTVDMTALTVNGTQPRYGDVFAQWMSLPGGDQAPTPLRGGAFTITHGVVTLGRQALPGDRACAERERSQARPRGDAVDRAHPGA